MSAGHLTLCHQKTIVSEPRTKARTIDPLDSPNRSVSLKGNLRLGSSSICKTIILGLSRNGVYPRISIQTGKMMTTPSLLYVITPVLDKPCGHLVLSENWILIKKHWFNHASSQVSPNFHINKGHNMPQLRGETVERQGFPETFLDETLIFSMKPLEPLKLFGCHHLRGHFSVGKPWWKSWDYQWSLGLIN